MKSPILPTAARFLIPVLLIFSIFLLLRGHDRPGGAFVAAIVAAAAFVLISIANGAGAARSTLRVAPRRLIGLGLAVGVGSGVLPLLFGDAFLAARWGKVPFPGGPDVSIGTPIIFEVGVFLTVLGAALTVILLLEEE